jgi:hypothetical protein
MYRHDFLKVLWIVIVASLVLALYRQWEMRANSRGR